MTSDHPVQLSTLAHVAVRSLFLEASWNPQGQQNLGLAAAIDPALRRLHQSREGLKSARERAMGFFNTNPIASGVAIGVIIKLEQDVAAGRLAAEDRVRMAGRLGPTLAALGDDLFWQSWLPLCCLIAVWAVLSLDQWWTPLLLPGLFGLLAVPVRFAGLYLGYRRGERIVELLFRLKIQRLAQGLRRLLALVVGVSTVVLISTKTALAADSSRGRLWLAMLGVMIGVFALRLMIRQPSRLGYWYPIVLVALACLLLLALGQY